MTRSALVGWYLSEIVGEELDSEEELAKRKYLVERVIERLVGHVSIWGILCFSCLRALISPLLMC